MNVRLWRESHIKALSEQKTLTEGFSNLLRDLCYNSMQDILHFVAIIEVEVLHLFHKQSCSSHSEQSNIVIKAC